MTSRCGHCGREGTLERVDDVVIERSTAEIHHYYGDDYGIQEVDARTYLRIERCTVCKQPTISSFEVVEDVHESEAFAVRAGRLLTEGNLGTRLDQLAGKKRARQVGEVTGRRMLEIANAPDASFRRHSQNRRTWSESFAMRTSISCRSILDLGIVATEVEDRDVPLIRAFVEGLLDFLYWGPARLERGRAALQKRIDDSASS